MSSRYKDLSPEELNEHFSKFLVNSWSYSSVSQFARNEKAFERSYIYGEKDTNSVSSVAGSAYHAALEAYFLAMKEGNAVPDNIKMDQIAFDYINRIQPADWKLQKTHPSVSDCISSATLSAGTLIKNFLAEKDVYLADIAEVLTVEEKWECWLTINGVDIPLPCHMRIDAAFRLRDGRVVVVDHKSVTSYSDEESVALTRGKQGITYFKGFEEVRGVRPDEVWFIENKATRNSDGSPQLKKYVLKMDADSQRLYEAMLYDPLRRMVQAVNDPDYIYTLNDSDRFVSMPEMYSFVMRTMIGEVSEFPNIREDKKELVTKRLRKVRDSSAAMVSPKVITAFRKNAEAFIPYNYAASNMTNSEKIEHVLQTFGQSVQVKHEIKGYSSDTYLLEMSAGVKVSNIGKYSLDIANALDVSNVRVSPVLVVHEGRSYLSIEVNKERTENLLWDKKYLVDRKIPLGIDNYGRLVVWDIDNSATPHLLDCGGTGSGKSVLIRSTIEYARDIVDRIIILDPKHEFGQLANEKIEVLSEIEDIELRMKELVKEMQSLKGAFNGYTLIIFDEFADAVASARSGKDLDVYDEQKVLTARGAKAMMAGAPVDSCEYKIVRTKVGRDKSLEENLKMILQKGRSLGYRVLAATQRASAKVITGDAKVNLTVQVCFKVAKAVDSKVVLDEEGAETLTGKGDGLIRSPQYLDGTVRFQGFFYKS